MAEDLSDIEIDTSRIVIVDGLPVVPSKIAPKLINVISKVLSKAGTLETDGVTMPEEDGKTLGFAFVEYTDSGGAATCVKNLDNWPLDKTHSFRINMYSDLKHCEVDDEFVPDEVEPYVERDDIFSWLLDERVRDQFVIRYDDETEVHWMEAKGRPVLEYGGEREKAVGQRWTEQRVVWSPQGAFLMTFAGIRGVVLWGGDQFHKIGRFPHHGVHDVVWSPCERYLITWNGYYGNTEMADAAIVWDVRTCTELRRLPQLRYEDNACDIIWSQDGNYCARLAVDPASGETLVKVYTLPSMKLLDGASIKAPRAQEISFCPARANILAWWSPEGTNSPASVTVMEIGTGIRRVLRQKNLFNVEDCSLIWHPSGDYLCLRSLRLTKAQMRRKKLREKAKVDPTVTAPGPEKTIVTTAFELFRLRDKHVPVEMVEIDERVIDFAWEPKGTRFSVVHGVGTAHRYNISFFDMGDKKSELSHKVTDKPCNQVVWSPAGHTCILAGLDSLSGVMEFYNVDTQSSIITQEHMQCNHVEYDPSGRFVMSAKKQPMVDMNEIAMRDRVENGYMLWTFQGQRIHEEGKNRFFQFIWRPRPRSLLSEAEEKKVHKNLKKHMQAFAEADKEVARRRRLVGLVEKRRLQNEFRSLVAELEEEYVAAKPDREARGIPDYDAGEEDDEVTVDVYDQILSQSVTRIS